MIFAPRPVLGVLWLVFLLAGGGWLRCHPARKPPAKPDPAAFAAKHALPENYRIGKADLEWSSEGGKGLLQQDFLGKYTAKKVASGGAVTVEDLRTQPAIESAADREAALLPLKSQPDLIDALNAGSKVNLFEDNRLLLKQVPVLALLCDPPAGSNCTAVLDLNRTEAQIYASRSPAKLRIILGKL